MSYDTDPRIHQATCSLVSGPDGTASFERANELINKVAKYARKLGVNVMHENVDRAESYMPMSTTLEGLDE